MKGVLVLILLGKPGHTILLPGNILPRVYLVIRKERLEGTKDVVIFKYKMRLQIQVDTRSEGI